MSNCDPKLGYWLVENEMWLAESQNDHRFENIDV
jgi:hypothetical protein